MMYKYFFPFLFITFFAKGQDSVVNLLLVTVKKNSFNSDNYSSTIKVSDLNNVNHGSDVPVLLQSIPSLSFSSDAGNGVGYTYLRLRGADNTRVNVTINGVPYNDPESQSVYWVDIADIISGAKDITVQRGIGSSTIGAGSFGGNININTIQNHNEGFLQLSNSIGSFGTMKNNVTFSTGLIKDIFEVSGRVSHIRSEGYIDRASSLLYSGDLSWKILGKKWNMNTMFFFGDEQTYQAWNGVAEADLANNRTKNISGTDFGAKPGEPYQNEVDKYLQNNFQNIFKYEINPNLKFSTTLHYTKGNGFYEEYKVDRALAYFGIDSVLTSDIVRRKWLNNDFYGAIANINYSKNQLDLQYTIAYNTYNSTHYDQLIKTISYTAPSLPITYYSEKTNKSEFNTFIKARRFINKLSMTGDIQFRRVSYTSDSINNINFSKNFINPKLSLEYKLVKEINLNFQIGYTAKEPNRSDFVDGKNSNLKPEEMMDIELGVSKKAKKYNLNINAYYMAYTNQLALTGQINDVGAYMRSNLSKSYRAGVELEGNYTICKSLSLMANATFGVNKIIDYIHTDYTFDENYTTIDSLTKKTAFDNNDISFSPNIIGYADIKYTPFTNFDISFQTKYTGSQYLDNTNTESKSIAAYTINNLVLGYMMKGRLAKEIRFSLMLNNIFDINYVSNGYTFASGALRNNMGVITKSTDYNYYFPQAGFNVMGGVTVRF